MALLKPSFPPRTTTSKTPLQEEPPSLLALIKGLSFTPHIEGGYFVETDRSPYTIPSPFPPKPSSSSSSKTASNLVPPPSVPLPRPDSNSNFNPSLRSLSTTIFYLLTPSNPQGGFHRNSSRTVHTLHRGRGRYVIIHADEEAEAEEADEEELEKVGMMKKQGMKKRKMRVETFIVGNNIEKGEKLQWIVEGGKFKASFLLPDDDDDDVEGSSGDEETRKESGGLLISETVVPGFEYADHDFLTLEGLVELVGEEKAEELKWLLSPLGRR